MTPVRNGWGQMIKNKNCFIELKEKILEEKRLNIQILENLSRVIIDKT